MWELTVDATLENIPMVTAFVDQALEALGCPPKAQIQLDIAIDELFGNIAHYAYSPAVGPATVRLVHLRRPAAVELTFEDGGIPFDPLAAANPNVSGDAEARDLGGLGIYMVKKSMDTLRYVYQDGKNILTIQKKFAQ